MPDWLCCGFIADVKTEEKKVEVKKLQDRKPRNEGNDSRKNLKICGFLIALLLSIGIYSYQDDVKSLCYVFHIFSEQC